jgi:biopolymer transport protein ExbB
VGEALIMTAFGLAVAVPAVLGYNWLVRRNKVALEQLRAFGADLHMVLISGGLKPRAATAAPVAAAR